MYVFLLNIFLFFSSQTYTHTHTHTHTQLLLFKIIIMIKFNQSPHNILNYAGTENFKVNIDLITL